METKYNFNSQVCTSKAQSERLLELGLKKDTADMTIHIKKDDSWYVTAEPFYEWEDDMNTLPSWEEPELIIPAWSLHRLLEMVTTKRKVMLVRIGEDLFDTVIEMIRKLITDGTFNKDYLEE